MFWKLTSYRLQEPQALSPGLGASSHFTCLLRCPEAFQLDAVPLVYFGFHCLWFWCNKTLPRPMRRGAFLILSPQSVMSKSLQVSLSSTLS